MPSLRLPQKLLVALVVLGSFAWLLVRSRPLQRFTGGAEALLYATGLNAPRALLSLEDGTILAAEGSGAAVRVVEVGVTGEITARPDAPAALLQPDTGTAAAVVPFPRLGTAWSVARAPDGGMVVALPHTNRVARAQVGGALLTLAEGFSGTGGRNPLPTAAAISPSGELYVALFATDADRPASGQIVRVLEGGRWERAFEGLILPVAMAFAPSGQLYVLELARRLDPQSGEALPKSGRLLAIGPAPHQRRTIARDLDLPSGLAITPAGDAYFTERGFQPAPGGAHLLRLPAGGLAPGAGSGSGA